MNEQIVTHVNADMGKLAFQCIEKNQITRLELISCYIATHFADCKGIVW